MTIWSGLSFLLRETLQFLKQAWWVVAILASPELLLEYLIRQPETDNWGIWDSELAGLGMHLIRLSLKLLVFFIFIRFMALGHNLREAITANVNALRSFAPFALTCIAFELSISYLVTEFEAYWLPELLRFVLVPLFALWAVSSPGGGKPISPMQSAKIALENLPWSILFLIVLGIAVTLVAWSIRNLAKLVGEQSGWFAAVVLIMIDCVEVIVAFAAIFVIARKSGLLIEPLGNSASLKDELS